MKPVAVLSSLICFAAGAYLLSTQAVAENSYLEVLAHGIGIYFLGKGLYVGPSLWQQAKGAEHLAYLAWFAHAQELRAAIPEVEPAKVPGSV